MKISEHFTSEEATCKCGCGFLVVNQELLLVLDDVRHHFGKPVHINSWCRCPVHNKKVGGVENGPHTKGEAADIVVKDVSEVLVADYLENKYLNKYGIGRYPGRTHIDVRPTKARWRGK